MHPPHPYSDKGKAGNLNPGLSKVSVGAVWALLVPTASSSGGARRRHQIPISVQVSLHSFWQKGLFPVPCDDSAYREVFNARSGINTNPFSPSSSWSKEGKLQSKEWRSPHKWLYNRAQLLLSEHPPPTFPTLNPPPLFIRQMSHVVQQSLQAEVLPALQEQVSISSTRHLHHPL